MAWDGSGNITRTDGTRTGATVWEQARDASVDVDAAPHDTHDQDLATAIENCLTRDGQTSPSGNLPMNSHKHTGVADAAVATEYAAYGQLLALVSPFVGATLVGGTANAITLTPTPTITAYTTGKGFSFFIETANTGAVTLSASGLAAVGLRRSDGTAFTSGDLVVGRHVVAVYNGAQFRTNIAPPTDAAVSLSVNDIPALPASKITSGSFNADRIPSLPASKITSGSFADTFIPSLAASKITSGTFGTALIPNLAASKTTSGTFNADRVGVSLTQAAYDALTPDANTLYFIIG